MSFWRPWERFTGRNRYSEESEQFNLTAPSGIGAPVIMRIAVPGTTVSVGRCPAALLAYDALQFLGALTWETIYNYDGVLQGNFTPWVVMSPNFGTDNTLFTSKVCEGVFRSKDRGETWEDVTSQLLFPFIYLVPGNHVCDPPGFRTLVFPSPSTAGNSLFVWTEVGIFRLSDFR